MGKRRPRARRLATRAVLEPVRSVWGRRVLGWGGRLAIMAALVWAALVAVREGHDYATTAPRFEVRGLIFEPTPHVPDEHLRELMALAPGTNILALDLDAVAEAIVADPWVKQAGVVRELPDTIRVDVTEHVPVAVLLSGYFYLVSDEGEPFKRLARGERQQLPIITGVDRKLLVDDEPAARERIAKALSILQTYGAKRRPRLSEIHLGENDAVDLYTAEKGTQLRLGRGPIGPKLDRYDALRAALGSDVDTLAIVHLDGSTGPGSKDRVVASFFAEGEPGLLAVAPKPDDDPLEEGTRPAGGPQEDNAKRTTKKRIPRYQ